MHYITFLQSLPFFPPATKKKKKKRSKSKSKKTQKKKKKKYKRKTTKKKSQQKKKKKKKEKKERKRKEKNHQTIILKYFWTKSPFGKELYICIYLHTHKMSLEEFTGNVTVFPLKGMGSWAAQGGKGNFLLCIILNL